MILARVVGSFWASVQYEPFDGKRLMMVVPWDPLSNVTKGNTLAAVDAVGSRIGDIVTILCEGGGARQVMGDARCPAEAVIVGIVDRIDVDSVDK